MHGFPSRLMRALIVSQDAHWRLQYVKELLARGADVHTAARAVDALDLLRKSRYDMIIVDESLEDQGLVEFALTLRDLLDHPPVTLVAGHDLRGFEHIRRQFEAFYAGDQENLLKHLEEAMAEAGKRGRLVSA